MQKRFIELAVLALALSAIACNLGGAASTAVPTPISFPNTTPTTIAVQPTTQPPATVIQNTAPPLSVPTVDTCSNAPRPQLASGMTARVSPGTSNNLRSQPAKSGSLLTTLPEGQQVDVVGGPVCADGYQWWQVKSDQTQGWTAEGSGTNYWLVPAMSASTRVAIPAGATSQSVSYGNISFVFGSTLSDHVLARTVFASPHDPSLPSFLNNSQRLEFSLNDFVYSGSTRPKLLTVYKISDLEGNDSSYTPMVDAMRTMLAQQPTVAVGSGLTSPITVIPVQNAGQAFHAQSRYFRSANTIGVRFITYYTQNPGPVDNQYLTYVYQGISDNGLYYISALIPITTQNISQLPAFNTPADTAGMTAYLNQVAQKIDTFAAKDFSPSLDNLDAWIASIQVN